MKTVVYKAPPAIDHSDLHQLAYDNLRLVTDLWDRSGRPIGMLRELNPTAPETRMRRFHILPAAGNQVGQFKWTDLETPGVGGTDLISVVEYLGNVDRDRAAQFLHDYLARAIPAARPAVKEGR